MSRLSALALALLSATAFGQGTPPASLPAPAPAKAKAAAVVNGREISEAAVDRALKPIAPAKREKARKDVLNFLIENALVDHYLELLKVTVDPKEVDGQLASFKKDVTDGKQDYAKVLARMEMTEADLKVEMHNQLRWEKFAAQQGTEEKLKKLFEASPEIFDGSLVRCRHILVTADPTDEKERAAALKKIQEVKSALNAAIASAAAKIPNDTDNLTRQKLLNRATEDAFSAAAREHSMCPSKRDGGLLGEFPRMGMMVEPFAKAAFALKPYQVSDPVGTPFGYHLILVTARKPGEPVKFEQVKGAVAEVYAVRLREAIVDKMKADPKTRIEILK
ncbi:MAG: peptidylprolyl isomerase [Zavarzinella sp.]|nr:peptidylprolyl isomerase [Zavarzinella sp.]